MGKILEVNLSDRTYKVTPIDENVARKYLGGKGYALWILYNDLKKLELEGVAPKDIDPLGPENTLIFATGPATGTAFPSSGRYHVMALRSPLTGSIASANSGGEFGPHLKFAGYDMIVIRGKSDTPVYISIIDGEVTIHDASDLWGKTVFDTVRILKERRTENMLILNLDISRGNISARVAMDVAFSEPSGNTVDFYSPYPDIPPFRIIVAPLEKILWDKLSAIIRRRKPRDLYDAYIIMRKYGIKIAFDRRRELREAIDRIKPQWRFLEKMVLVPLPEFEDVKNTVLGGV